MQANIYAPERQPNESLSEYRARRQAQSKLAYGRQIFSPSKYELSTSILCVTPGAPQSRRLAASGSSNELVPQLAGE